MIIHDVTNSETCVKLRTTLSNLADYFVHHRLSLDLLRSGVFIIDPSAARLRASCDIPFESPFLVTLLATRALHLRHKYMR